MNVEKRKEVEPAQDASLPESTPAANDSSYLETSQLID